MSNSLRGLPDRLRFGFRKYGDLLLALSVIAIVGVLLMQVPPWLMDGLLALNLSAAVGILMVALYAADASRLPSFPTILLLATLFRLALNVSSTKLILGDGTGSDKAGQVIEAFGQFVVGGDPTVGAVVFLVLVLVQFIVIAKGSERVAEVSARFTLDAMPGKQMSIDADVRSQAISEAEARDRREALDRESKLYGAMDGAMKFVKGDAIAGLVISAINIVGGLVIGCTRRGMELGEAFEQYTLLTIGDGLVSQIPALLISVSAGLVVTRVASASTGSGGRLARDLFEQVLENPRALGIAGGLMAVVGVSGPLGTDFPIQWFLPIGLLAIGLAVFEARRRPAQADAEFPESPDAKQPADAESDQHSADRAPRPSALVVDVHPSLATMFLSDDPGRRTDLTDRCRRLRDHLQERLGITFPPINFRPRSRHFPEHGYAFQLHGGLIASGRLSPEHAAVMASVERLQEHGIEARPLTLAGTRQPLSQVPLEHLETLRELRLPVLPAQALVLWHLREVLLRHAGEVVGVQDIADRIHEMEETHRDLVEAVTPRHLSLAELTEVVRGLLREQVPVGDLSRLLESLARQAPVVKHPDGLIEHLRTDLRRSLCASLARGGQHIVCHSLGADLDRMLRDGGPQGPEPQDEDRLLQALQATIDPNEHQEFRPVLLVRADLRQLVRDLLDHAGLDVAVLADRELAPEYELDHRGEVALREEAA